MTQLEVPIDVLAEFFHRVQNDATVADTIGCFHRDHGCDHCNNCGGPATDCCASCKTMRYCSAKCLEEDWTKGGHQEECKAIRERLPWRALSKEVLGNQLPDENSISGRHLVRLMGAFQSIERGGGGHMSGGGGFGGGGGHMTASGGGGGRPMMAPSGVRPAMSPSMHAGHARNYGYHRYASGYRGHAGMAYNGRPMGYWGGWAFPWIMMGSFWYPYWFFLTESAMLQAFYAAQRAQTRFYYQGKTTKKDTDLLLTE